MNHPFRKDTSKGVQNTSMVWTILFVLSFVGVSLIAVRTTVITTQQQEELRIQNTQEALIKFLEVWEDGVVSQLNFWISSLDNRSDIQTLEQQWKSTTPWLDNIVVWTEDQWIYPPPITTTPSATCLQSAPTSMDCTSENIEVQNQASLIKAEYWTQQGDLERAQFELLSSRPALRNPSASLNLSDEGRLIFFQRRFLLFQTETLGAPISGGQSLVTTSLSEANLIHPILLPNLLEILPILSIENFDWFKTTERLSRRNQTWSILQEYKQKNVVHNTLEITPLSDNDPPLLITHITQKNGIHVAITLDVPTLMETLTTQRTGFQPLVLDSNSSIVYPTKNLDPTSTTWIQIPGPQFFPQYRVAISTTVQESLYPQLLITLMPILLTGVLGFIAIYGSLKADRQQMDFIQRQQEFIARVTHELKTPLAGIRLMAESLEMNQDSQTAPFIEKILQESTRLESRIDEVLQVAKDTEIKKLVRMDTEMLLLELYDIWQPRFQDVKGVLRTECDSVEIMGDEILLKDAIQNLLSNSIKYRHPNRNLRCILSIQATGKWIKISVVDNGIGVPQVDRKRIFERFVRIEGEHRGFAGGHGLGLAFVAETATAHKGWIRCTDGLQGGVTITLGMPIVADT